MSTCVSRHGEYGSHTDSGEPFVCGRCGVIDVDALLDENARLRRELDEAQLRSIGARNPGIDMEDVKRIRSGVAPQEPEQDTE